MQINFNNLAIFNWAFDIYNLQQVCESSFSSIVSILCYKELDKQIMSQFGNVVPFKIIVVSCAVEIISCAENQLCVW